MILAPFQVSIAFPSNFGNHLFPSGQLKRKRNQLSSEMSLILQVQLPVNM